MIELELQHAHSRRHHSMLTKDLERAIAAAEFAEAEAAAATDTTVAVWGLGGVEKQELVTHARLEPKQPIMPFIQQAAMQWPINVKPALERQPIEAIHSVLHQMRA